MKKLKGVAAMKPSPYPVPFEDPRNRLKFQSLLQDYQDLQQPICGYFFYKLSCPHYVEGSLLPINLSVLSEKAGLDTEEVSETDAMNKKMQIMKQRKLTLLAEVRFLRRRLEYLTENNSLHLKQLQNPIKGKPRNSDTQSKQIIKRRNYTIREASLQPAGNGFKSNKKSQTGNGKKAVSQNPKPRFMEKAFTGKGTTYQNFSPVFDFNQGDLAPLPMQKSGLVFDLNPKERPQAEKEASMGTRAPSFDLNQISKDDEEVQNNTEFFRIEEARRSSFLGGTEEQLNNVKLPGCRRGPNRNRKRKITWQDQVALRV